MSGWMDRAVGKSSGGFRAVVGEYATLPRLRIEYN
ncbi:hypothetical protein DFP98_12897 [Cohnella phaseoli]|uniref:Uncharacterized protein n=1 Tax=Cohnella phaseoli TaxID=456490 RepID=A0A3D9IJT3_9BACL|nr:hypothetical protein DFP98_12897 [Cohnella phaseoli]